MRPQLVGGGILVALMGAGFYVLQLPLVYFWSIPFGIGGVIMIVAGFLLPEGQTIIAPPEGHRFCVYCSSPVPIAAERCPHCDGVQPRTA